MYEMTKADWKLYRERLPGWQEAHMEKLTREYIDLLSGSGKGSDKWWALEERIQQDKKSPGVIVTLRKSETPQQLLSLLLKGIISEQDLDGFSDDLRDRILYLYRSWMDDAGDDADPED